MPKVLGGVLCDEEELAGLGDHHHEAVESVSWGEFLVDDSIAEIALGPELSHWCGSTNSVSSWVAFW